MEEDWLCWLMKTRELEEDISEFSDVVSLASESWKMTRSEEQMYKREKELSVISAS